MLSKFDKIYKQLLLQQSISYDFDGDSQNLASRVIAALTLSDNAKYIRLFEQFKKATNDKELRQQLTDILNEIDDIKENPEDYKQTIVDMMSNENSHKLFKLVLNKYKRRKTSNKGDSGAKGLLD